MTIPNAVDLSTIIGRIVAALRHEQGATQAALAERMSWDRSLLARIESGRNTANIDHLFELEETYLADGLIRGHGALLDLCNRVVREAKRRGLRPVVGNVPKPEGEEAVEPAVLDRIVARIVDDWLQAMTDKTEPQPKPAPKRRR